MMKRRMSIVGILVIVLLGFTGYARSEISSDYQFGVKAGDEFTFEIKAAHSEWDITTPDILELEDSTGVSDGFNITDTETNESKTLNVGDSFTLRINGLGNRTNIGPYVNYSLLSNETVENNTIYPDARNFDEWGRHLFGSGILSLLTLGTFSGKMDLNWFMYTSIVYADDQWWTDLESGIKNIVGNITDIQGVSFTFEKENTTEFGISTEFKLDESSGYNLQKVDTKFRMVWDKSTGVFLGVLLDTDLNFRLDISGFGLGISKIVIKSNYEIIQKQFTIKTFGGGGAVPGFDIILLLPTIAVFALVRKR